MRKSIIAGIAALGLVATGTAPRVSSPVHPHWADGRASGAGVQSVRHFADASDGGNGTEGSGSDVRSNRNAAPEKSRSANFRSAAAS